jgi:hypothetical protein
MLTILEHSRDSNLVFDIDIGKYMSFFETTCGCSSIANEFCFELRLVVERNR